MKRLLLSAIALVVASNIVQAQDRARTGATLRRDGTTTTDSTQPQREVVPERVTVSVTQTPEMWLYEQERSRWEDPQAAVRRNAEFRASQRAYRIASMRWYGMSNSRPTANPTPLFGTYSPTWVSSNPFDRNQWRPGYDSASTIILVR